MLELVGIKKDYPAGSGVVHALKGVDVKFRRSEFVAILGPSGCGKTTMLNIIGGLDGYTDGDLGDLLGLHGLCDLDIGHHNKISPLKLFSNLF